MFRACLIAAAVWLIAAPAFAAAPRVVVSVKPLHSLVAGVMEGVAAPDLLLKGGGSAHTYTFKPSDAQALNAAELVIWVGPGFENFLERPLASLAGKARTLELMETPGLIQLTTREGGVWEAHEDHAGHEEHDHDAHGGAHDHSNIDGHIWLDPRNARVLAAKVADVLAEMDAANADRYRANAAALGARIDSLDAALAAQLAPVKTKPFVLFHDALQYFQARYGLNAVGSITVSPDRMAGARRIVQIRNRITDAGAVCIFAEPQFEPKLIRTLEADTGAKGGTLDPEGSLLPPGGDLYFHLMQGLADNLTECLR